MQISPDRDDGKYIEGVGNEANAGTEVSTEKEAKAFDA